MFLASNYRPSSAAGIERAVHSRGYDEAGERTILCVQKTENAKNRMPKRNLPADERVRAMGRGRSCHPMRSPGASSRAMSLTLNAHVPAWTASGKRSAKKQDVAVGVLECEPPQAIVGVTEWFNERDIARR